MFQLVYTTCIGVDLVHYVIFRVKVDKCDIIVYIGIIHTLPTHHQRNTIVYGYLNSRLLLDG